MARNGKIRLVHALTVPLSLEFIRGQAAYMKARGIDIQCITSFGSQIQEFAEREGVSVHVVEMTRRITPLRDLVSLFALQRTLLELRPLIVHGSTPKAGMLSMIAACGVRVPVRVYQIRGLPFVTAVGIRRVLLKWSERLSCSLAHLVICNSRSLMELAVDEGLCRQSKIKVLLSGSSNGVDADERFNPEHYDTEVRGQAREKYGIARDDRVIGFVGRCVKDKGIAELYAAWQKLRNEFSDLHLLLVGDFEPQDPVSREIQVSLRNDQRVHMTGWIADTALVYSIMNVLILPTYREGFPNAPLEAAAMSLPVVATDVPGCVDAVQDGVTGTLVPARNADALTKAIEMYLNDSELRTQHGSAGRKRVLRDFQPEMIWEALYDEYLCLLQETCILGKEAKDAEKF